MLCRSALIVVAALVLAGCAGLAPSGPAVVSIVFDQPDRSRFSGKGAGAGMMLSSTMGAAGVAIGIAIDEGIGKDIQAAADAGAVKVKPLLIEALRKQAKLAGREITTAAAAEVDLAIAVKRYGFILQPGSDDPAAAQFALVLSRPGDRRLELHYPEDFTRQSALPLPTRPLGRLKSDAGDIEFLWRAALERIFADSRVVALLQQ